MPRPTSATLRALARAAALGALLCVPLGSQAATQRLVLEPASTAIRFTLGATLHTAEGTIRLQRGALLFDADAGTASGEIVVDARSAETGSERRDANMHRDVLESERFATITFRAERLEVARRDATSAEVRLVGSLDLHGRKRPFAIPATLAAREGGHVAISSAFRVPYVDWGMVDYSTLVLRVDRFVDVNVEGDAVLAAP